MVKSIFSLILHSPFTALDLSIPIAKKPTTPVRRSQIPTTSSGRLLEMHSNIREEVVGLIKDQRSETFVASRNMGALKVRRVHRVNEFRGAEGAAQAKIHARASQGELPTGEALQAAVSRPLG